MPNYTPPSAGGGGGGAPSGAAGGELAGTYPNPTVADAVIDDANVVVGGLTNAALAAAAAIANTKLATNPLARANHTGTQAMATISDAGALATLSAIASAQITDGTIVGADLSSSIALPSGATASTQSAADSTTKLATTAYVDTAGALKANLASPTLTGTPSLPTGTTGVTQSAADGSTKLATTSYVDTADALKANLASPTFTGTPTLPTGAIASTQTANDNSTKLATTAYTDAVNNAVPGYQFAVGCYSSIPIAAATQNIGSTSAGDARWIRVVMPRSGTIVSLTIPIITTGGGVKLFILDTGQANATHTTRTCLAISGTVTTTANNTWQTDWNPSLAVTKGDVLEFGFAFDGTAAKAGFASNTSSPNAMPTAYLTPNGTGTATAKATGSILAANVPAAVNGTVTDANMAIATAMPLFIWRIT